MRSLDFGRYALCSCMAAAMLAGCGASQPPIGAQGTMPQSRVAATTHANRGGSWMLPEAQTQDLLYVANSTTVTVYSYPGGQHLRTLYHFYDPQGECVDKNGDVFITNFGGGQIFEYAHGGTKRIATLKSPTGGPIGCSVDPTTGNLAVSAFGGMVGIYKGARGKPEIYTDPQIAKFYWCAYDNVGNLFVDGQDSGGGFRFAELRGSPAAFTDITLNQSIGWPAGVQWQGDRVLVGDQNSPAIYEFKISGKSGSKVGRTLLGSHANFVLQFWVEKQTLIAPNVYYTGQGSKMRVHFEALYFKYPVGGKATKAITDGLRFPTAAVISAVNR